MCLLDSTIRVEDRCRRLLGLEEQRIALVATLEQDDEAARADTADADDLEREVDESIALDQLAAVLGERRAVVAERPFQGRRPPGSLDVGCTTGGSSSMRQWPSTTAVNEPLAFIWSLPRALAEQPLGAAWASFGSNFGARCFCRLDHLVLDSSAVVWSYQISSSRISE